MLKGVEEFAERPLPEEKAFVHLDGFFLKVLREGVGVERAAVHVALGVTPNGERLVLGFWLLPTENAHAWEGVSGELWRRGLRRVLLFVTDGIEEAIKRVYPMAGWQRCVVHQVRASRAQVRSRDRALLAQDLKEVYRAGSRKEALEALERLRGGLGSQVPFLGGLLVGELRGVAALLRLPPGALALSAEHQPDGAALPIGQTHLRKQEVYP